MSVASNSNPNQTKIGVFTIKKGERTMENKRNSSNNRQQMMLRLMSMQKLL